MDLLEGDLSNPIDHWYYAHKFRVIEKLIGDDLISPTHLIDVGAGSALFSLALLKNFPL
jgi:hypothetical protein